MGRSWPAEERKFQRDGSIYAYLAIRGKVAYVGGDKEFGTAVAWAKRGFVNHAKG